jgi:hypothetical protein
MAYLLSRAGLRYNDSGSDPGAQTERPGWLWPVRASLSTWVSPAVLFGA